MVSRFDRAHRRLWPCAGSPALRRSIRHGAWFLRDSSLEEIDIMKHSVRRILRSLLPIAPSILLSAPVIAAPHATLVGGESFDSAVSIPSLPFTDTGYTCGFANDVEAPLATCGLANGPDVFYTYTPTFDQCVRMDLCNSQYNTMLEVFDASHTLVECNDNYFPDRPECGLTSLVKHVHLTGGQQYFIAVDGFAGDCGNYQMAVSECPPACSTECPAGAIVEQEPPCGLNNPPSNDCSVFDLPCSDTELVWCGTYGFYTSPVDSELTNDLDTFRFTLTAPSTVTACVCGPQGSFVEFSTYIPDCYGTSLGRDSSEPGEAACVTVSLPAGTYRIGVTDDYSAPCGTPYVMRVSGLTCPPVAATPTTWANMKRLYR
jgi:hypothetical protein